MARAGRGALDRMLAEHEAVRARLRALTVTWLRDSDERLTRLAEVRRSEFETARGRRIDAAAQRLRAAAERVTEHLAGGSRWRLAPWPEVGAAGVESLHRPEAGPDLIRIGTIPYADGAQTFAVPFGAGCHVTTDRSVRDERAANLLLSVLTRRLAARPGAVRVVVHDPAGLGQFVLPYQPLLRTGTIEVRPTLASVLDEAERRIRDAVTAGPARSDELIVVVTDLVQEPGRAGADRLRAVARAGPQAGVHLLLAGVGEQLDATVRISFGTAPDGSVTLPGGAGFGTVTGDAAPPAALIAALCDELVRHHADRSRMRFADLLPDRRWTESSAPGLAAPVGRDAQSDVVLRFDDRTVHWLIGGRSGAGKTNFLLTALMGLCARYSPDELAVYLLDFKQGVSFHEFVPTGRDPAWIPHARAVGVESDREYGVAVLSALRAEIDRRAVDMKRAGVPDLPALRAARPDASYPRVVAVIDEFQVLLGGNDPVARDAVGLLEELARMGRSYGVHLVLASQTLAGIESLYVKGDSIFTQFALRVALPGGGGVLDKTNAAADALTVGQAVLNDQGGIDGSNRLVRIPHAEPAAVSALQHELWRQRPDGAEPPRVFRGYARAVVDADPTYAALRPGRPDRLLLVGRHVDADGSTAAVPLGPTPGRHLAVVGSRGREAPDVLDAAVRGLARQHEPGEARFLLVPIAAAAGDVVTARHAGLRAAGHRAELVPPDELVPVLSDLATQSAPEPAYLVLFGADGAGPLLAAPQTGPVRTGRDALRTVAQQGPLHGVHLIGWWQSLGRLAQDLGPGARDDIACHVMLNVPPEELRRFLGTFDLYYVPRDNRALLVDRHANTTDLIVPFGAPDDEDAR